MMCYAHMLNKAANALVLRVQPIDRRQFLDYRMRVRRQSEYRLASAIWAKGVRWQDAWDIAEEAYAASAG